MGDLTIRELQTKLPWTVKYSEDFRKNPQSHKDFAHALCHASKAVGKLHGLVDDMDHNRELATDPGLREQYAKYVADLVVCALRIANTFPGGVIDLQKTVKARIEEKNGVSLEEAEPKDLFRHPVGRESALVCPDCDGSGRVQIGGNSSRCSMCSSSGRIAGIGWKKCTCYPYGLRNGKLHSVCHGYAQVPIQPETSNSKPPSKRRTIAACEECQGVGYFPGGDLGLEPCRACNPEGK